MSKAKEILEKLKQRREEGEAVRAYWLELFPELGELNQIQANTWLIQYDIYTVIAGLESAAIKVNKVDHAVENGRGEEMTAMRVVKYASMCMRNTGLTDEERQVKDEIAKELRAKRSAAGKKGNAKRWHSEPEIATVCDDSRSDATVLPRYTGTGTGSGTGTATGRGTGTGKGKAAPANLDKREEQNQTPKPTPTPTVVSSSSANLEPKAKPTPKETIFGAPVPNELCPFHREEIITASRLNDAVSSKAVNDVMQASYGCDKCTHPKAPARKCPKCGEPWSRDKTHTCAKAAAAGYEEYDVPVKTGRLNLGTADDLSGEWITTKDGLRMRGL